MRIERVTLTNFRCFGPEAQNIQLSGGVTAFIGANGSGKTAVMQALSRLFGVTNEQRRVRRQDFHVPQTETVLPTKRSLVIEVLLGFPELLNGDTNDTDVVPEFFHQMASDDHGNLKCRLRLDATWTEDGSAEGAIDTQLRVVRTLSDRFEESDCSNVQATDRMRIQMVYVPAVRDGGSQVATFLRGRLWRAISWSDEIRDSVKKTGIQLNTEFNAQAGVEKIATAVRQQWEDILSSDAQSVPQFRPVDQRFDEFVRRVEVMFSPGEAGRDAELSELSDGHRSLFHIAMTVAALHVESAIRRDGPEGFLTDRTILPSLTLLALEEPENNLAPFYLSRIVRQIQEVSDADQHAQGLISSHSASLLSRIAPGDVRHFRLEGQSRVSQVRSISLPNNADEAGKFVREGVRRFPELYFARFVVLGEGSSEEIVLPRLAEALDSPVDKSFVAVVPLGGRHVNHLWRLLSDLEIPHATLLDLDAGRAGGGWGRIKTTCAQLIANGISPDTLFGSELLSGGVGETLASFDGRENDRALLEWAERLRTFNVFFSAPLDLDLLMLKALPDAYQQLSNGMRGPDTDAEALAPAEAAVLGSNREDAPWGETTRALFPWYRYLFLGRSKPSTHLRVLTELSNEQLKAQAPEVLVALLTHVEATLRLRRPKQG